MAELVLGVGASHSTLMNSPWPDAPDRALRFRAGLDAARAEIAAAAPDAVLLVGSNHFRGMWLDMVPQFTLGVGAVTASGEAGTPSGPQPADPELARHVAQALVGEEFDVAISTALQIDHGQSHAIQYLVPDRPVVPLVVNVFAPPLPSLRRCVALGHALRRAVASFPGARRVAVVGSGGLSHRLPFPDWRAPQGADQEFLVDAWTHGRARWTEFEERRRAIVRAFPPDVNEGFDRAFLAAVEGGRTARYTRYDDDPGALEREAGNGAHEIRAWLVAAAAAGGPGRVLAYEPMPEWLTGMGVAIMGVST